VTGFVLEPVMLAAILPEIMLLVLAMLVLAMDLSWKVEQKRNLGWLTAGGLVLIGVVLLLIDRPTDTSQSFWGGMVRYDWLAFTFKMLFLFGGAITCLFAMEIDHLGKRGEFYLLLLASMIGMCFMASAGDLIMLYLAIEATSIPLYVLAGFLTRDQKSPESGFKYLLFGALTSTIMLYGFSLFYGFAGTTNLYDLAKMFQGSAASLQALVPLIGALLLVLVGFGFKISAVPFHFWAPDVYEGAPTPVAGFLSTASKAAGFAVLMRVLMAAMPPDTLPYWTVVVAVLSVASMTLGNAAALAQRNIKRLLAYSSIAHAGYALIGIVAASQFGLASVVFYMVAYIVTNLAAFGIVATFWRVSRSDDVEAYYGLSRRSPGLALAMLVAFLSLAGMPPLGGFVGKVFVFAAAVNSGLVWLAVVGVLNSIVGLYYYLTVLKYVYLYPPKDTQPIPVARPYAIALVVLVFGIILIGTLFGPWFTWSSAAASALF
jgi:NADH-quinone oxidoreductase subunit N